ncbi:MAG TPA: hypothetical protein VKW78_08575 [Terriglobales bacterium]|jgi:DNA uptake protein ComE-like DNA-binding protein|nr:hypothetical protein [Terriglobales bacterium]
MKKLLGGLGAGLLVALAIRLLWERRSGITRDLRDKRRNEPLPDAEQIAEEMRDTFVPDKINTGQPSAELLDLNSCSAQELLSLGEMDSTWATRIVESRPYRNKMDLLSRMIIPADLFAVISERVMVAKPDEQVKIA